MSTGMLYRGVFNEVAVTAAQDLFELVAPADACVIVHEIHITQSSDTDSEQLLIRIRKGLTSSGSGGSTPTPTPTHTGFAAAGSTLEANNTTQASGGSPTTEWSEGFNVLNGFHYVPVPESRIVLSPSQRLTVELDNAPADSLTMSGVIVFEEIGG